MGKGAPRVYHCCIHSGNLEPIRENVFDLPRPTRVIPSEARDLPPELHVTVARQNIRSILWDPSLRSG